MFSRREARSRLKKRRATKILKAARKRKRNPNGTLLISWLATFSVALTTIAQRVKLATR
jgi:hypothetical protein